MVQNRFKLTDAVPQVVRLKGGGNAIPIIEGVAKDPDHLDGCFASYPAVLAVRAPVVLEVLAEAIEPAAKRAWHPLGNQVRRVELEHDSPWLARWQGGCVGALGKTGRQADSASGRFTTKSITRPRLLSSTT